MSAAGCWPSVEQELLLDACLSPAQRAAESFWSWRYHADLTSLDGVTMRFLPLLHHRLRDGEWSGPSPDSEFATLSHHLYLSVWRQNQEHFRTSVRLQEDLRGAGVECLFVKGVALALRHSPCTGVRSMGDIDLLVHRSNLTPALDVLFATGWTFFEHASDLLDKRLVKGGDLPRKRPNSTNVEAPLLTIGMSTYDDFDGVYFSVQAIRLYHPEIADQAEIVIIDNHPEGAHGAAVAQLEQGIQNLRYVPAKYPRGTSSRDLIFREARGEFVLCMDCHVLFPAGRLKRLIDFLVAHRESKDLFQGPMLYDSLDQIAAHWNPEWRDGMWGTWADTDKADDVDAAPFEIPSQGLGVFACRRDAWPGFNPRLRGFGGEEGCLHEKFRQRGAKTWCLPFLRWMHRFARPGGTPYTPQWKDRIRNYLIWFEELAMDPAPLVGHFEKHVGLEPTMSMVEAARRDLVNPFHYFDAIYCINLASAVARWEAVTKRFAKLGIADSVRRFAAIETPHNHHIGCALSHRIIIAEAKKQGLRNVLVFEDDVIFSHDALHEMRNTVSELRHRQWGLFYLGGHRWGITPEKIPGCCYLQTPIRMTCSHAIAYDSSIYDQILFDVPETATGAALWLRTHFGIDQYYASAEAFDGHRILSSPVIATQGSILAAESRLFDEDVPDGAAAGKAAEKALSAMVAMKEPVAPAEPPATARGIPAKSAEAIILSKGRALQLDALLRSIDAFAPALFAEIRVFYTAESETNDAFRLLRAQHPGVHWCPYDQIQPDLQDLIASDDRRVLREDDLFYRNAESLPLLAPGKLFTYRDRNGDGAVEDLNRLFLQGRRINFVKMTFFKCSGNAQEIPYVIE